MSSQRLKGRVAVVTGASSGIGQGIALGLAKEGCAVALGARRSEIIQGSVDNIVKEGGKAIAMSTDVTKRADVKALVAAAEQELGPVDILVNAAGVMYFTLMKNLHEDEWERTIDTNVKGVVNGVGAVFAGMLARKNGHIINISSDAAKQVFPALTVYNASKAFVSTFSKGLRAECCGTGVKVTDIQPGDVGTSLLVSNTDKEAAEKVGVIIGKQIEGERNSVLDVSDIVDSVLYVLTAPAHVGIHELLIEPRDQMWGDPTSLGC